MAGKRQTGTLDHMMYNKLSRIEVTPPLPATCPGRITPTDLQMSKNFLSYPVPGSKEHISSSAWNTATVYRQYADGAFNQHLQTGVSDKCERLDIERLHTPLQHSDAVNNHFSVNQNHPFHNYLMSPPRACPPIVMPRPVYRSPSNLMDASYGTMGVCVGSQSLCPPSIEWSSFTGFPFPSSPSYASVANHHFSTHNKYPEVAGISSSLPRGLQERSPVQRHTVNTSLAVGVSPICSQQVAFKNHCHAFAPPNVQLRQAESSIPVERQRSSAFNVPSHHKQSSTCQNSLDSRMAHPYPKSHYNNTMNRIPQRSFPLSCMEMVSSPHSIRGSAVYPSSVQKMHSGFVNTETTVRNSYSGGNLQKNLWAEKDTQSGHTRTNTELQCSAQRDKDFLMGSGQMNRDVFVSSSKVGKERPVDTSQANNCSPERNIYRDHFTEQSAHLAFLQQNSVSNITPNVSVNDIMPNQSSREYTITSKMATVHNPFISFESSVTADAKFTEHSSQTKNKKSNINTEFATSTILVSVDSSGVASHYQKSDDSMKVKEHSALLAPTDNPTVTQVNDCSKSPLMPVSKHIDDSTSRYPSEPGNKGVDICGSKSSPLPVNNDMDIDCPKSPPMPVINDVFSLAPYCAYLEGKTNPFPSQGWDVKNTVSTSLCSQQPFLPERTRNVLKEFPKTGNITKMINDECPKTAKNQKPKTLQTGETHGVSIVSDKTDGETVVLDLSLKKSHQNISSPCDQDTFSHHNQETLSSVVIEKCLNKSTEKNLKQLSDDSCRSQVSAIISYSGQESCPSQTTEKMFCPNEENHSFEGTSRMSGLESCLSTKTVFYKSQGSLLSQVTEAQPGNNFPYLAVNYPKENCQSQATNSLARQLKENYPSQIIENLSSHFQENCPSQAPKSLPCHLQESYKSSVTQTQTHKLHENSPSERRENMPHHGQSSCMSVVTTAKPVYTSLTCSSQSSNFSLYVNSVQTPFLPQTVILASPPPVYCPKNLKLHTSQQYQSTETPGRRAKNPLGTCCSITSSPGSENEANGFHSSKSFMFRKYKMMKFSSSAGEMQAINSDSSSHSSPFPLPLTTVQSLPPSAPESSPTLGEANVSLANVDELTVNGSGQHFSELHRSVRAAIKSSVVRSPLSLLEDWVAKTKEEERSRTPVKSKNGSRPYDHSLDSPYHDIWLAFDGVRLLLHKLISQLETFMFTRICPFPHVIRAGAIFIPIYLVKIVLFPELLGPSVDRILQKHKVELRPTTLSEEKHLRETELKGCTSRMLKLLALKQLPDVYPDLINLFCGHTIQQQLDNGSNNGLEKVEFQITDSSNKEPQTQLPSKKGKRSLILKLKRICEVPGSQVYKSQRLRTPEKVVANKIQKRKVYCKENYRTRTMFTYKKRRRGRRKSFPDLVGRRILHLFDDGKQDVWFPGKVLRVHKRSRNPRDTQYEVWYDGEPGTRYFLELLQDYEKGWLKLDS